MANDLAGLAQTISDFFNALPLDKGITYENEQIAQMQRQWTALFKAKAAANGFILP